MITLATFEEAHTLHDLGPVDRIPMGEGRIFLLGTHTVAVFRTRTGDLYAVQSDCPHAGGSLADGLVGGGRVVCPLHGRTFDLQTGREVRDACPALRTYAVRSNSYGRILLEMPEAQR